MQFNTISQECGAVKGQAEQLRATRVQNARLSAPLCQGADFHCVFVLVWWVLHTAPLE